MLQGHGGPKGNERSWSDWSSLKSAVRQLLMVYSSYFTTAPGCAGGERASLLTKLQKKITPPTCAPCPCRFTKIEPRVSKLWVNHLRVAGETLSFLNFLCKTGRCIIIILLLALVVAKGWIPAVNFQLIAARWRCISMETLVVCWLVHHTERSDHRILLERWANLGSKVKPLPDSRLSLRLSSLKLLW